MKFRVYYTLIAIALLAAILPSPARSQSRIGYVDATKLLKQMPEAMDAESHLNQFVAQWNKEIADMQTELTRKVNDYDRKKLIMTDAERSAAELDIADLRKRIESFRQAKYGPNGELGTQQESLMKNAYDKLNKALEEVALDGKYDYVFDKSAKELALLYTNAKFDLTSAVAKKLGIETNDIFSIPLLNNSNPGQTQPPPMQQSPVGVPPHAPGQPIVAPPSGNAPMQPPK
jgi:Skp family chaperone for outer membrane proteins